MACLLYTVDHLPVFQRLVFDVAHAPSGLKTSMRFFDADCFMLQLDPMASFLQTLTSCPNFGAAAALLSWLWCWRSHSNIALPLKLEPLMSCPIIGAAVALLSLLRCWRSHSNFALSFKIDPVGLPLHSPARCSLFSEGGGAGPLPSSYNWRECPKNRTAAPRAEMAPCHSLKARWRRPDD